MTRGWLRFSEEWVMPLSPGGRGSATCYVMVFRPIEAGSRSLRSLGEGQTLVKEGETNGRGAHVIIPPPLGIPCKKRKFVRFCGHCTSAG